MARGTFGERLKRERELREVTLQEITTATRIGTRFLEALENEEWEKLPGGVFNRGFVRSVARYLGLDEEALLSEYDMAYGLQVPPAEERPAERIPSPSEWYLAAILLGVLVLLTVLVAGGYYAWRHFAARRSLKKSVVLTAPSLPQPPTQHLSLASPPSPSEAVTPATSSPPLDLLVSASSPTHLRVQADSNLVFDNELHAGENRHFAAREGFEISATDSGAVLLELNGQAMPPLGLPGSSGTMKLGRKDLRQVSGGNSQP